jgi:hypothetical protein
LQIVAASLGLILGMITWFTASHWLASSILWFESRYPKLAGSKRLRAYEIVICGLLVLTCFAVAALIMRLMLK